MKSFLTGLVFLFSLTIYSYEFKNFKITEGFKEKLKNNKKTYSRISSFDSSVKKEKSSIDDDNQFYASLLLFLLSSYQNIGYDKTDLIIDFNESFILGDQNHSGFTWEHPFGSFFVNVERQVLPNNYGDYDWIVNDVFTISIDAQKYLGDLKKEGLIEISDAAFGAFFGITFKRIYTYNHFAETFEEGLVSDFSKAFLGFQKFRENTITELEEYEFISKEDVMVVGGRAEAFLPVALMIGAGAEIYAEYNSLKKVTVQALGRIDRVNENEKFLISQEKIKGASTGASIGLQIDFFNLLKLTLMEYELSYNWTDEESIYLNFYEDELGLIIEDTPVSLEISKLLRFKKINHSILDPFIISIREMVSKSLISNLMFFSIGSITRHQGDQIKLINGGENTFFYRGYSTSLKYIETATSFFWSAILKALLGMNPFARYEISKSREVSVEYRGESIEEVSNESLLNSVSEDNLSVKITQKFTSVKTTGRIRKSIKKRAAGFAENFTYLDSSVPGEIASEVLVGPMSMRTTVYVKSGGIDYFNAISDDRMHEYFAQVCGIENSEKWKSSWYRKIKLLFGFGKKVLCVKPLSRSYVKYKKVLHETGLIRFKKLKSLLYDLNKRNEKVSNMNLFFGEENIFIDGYIKAKTKSGFDFKTYFERGSFQDKGLIDFHMRSSGLRAPAYIGGF